MDKIKISHDLFLRYQLIEIIAYWEGRLTTNHLIASYGISRQQASKAINEYNKKIAPGNLTYDASLKGFRASDSFKPRFSQGVPEEYLYLISNIASANALQQTMSLKPASCEVLQPPMRNVDPEVVRSIVQACQDKTRLEVEYFSMTNPKSESRVIAPHTLVHNGARWHTRAYCEKNRAFRDFVLSRFRSIPEVVSESDKSQHDDADWNTWVEILIKPDPRLNKEQRNIIEREYYMVKGLLRIRTRGPLVKYQLQLMQIDDKTLRGKGASQQIIVDNLEELERWLF